jgi:uncharacterized membrane protein YjjP (DUF1212 family)
MALIKKKPGLILILTGVSFLAGGIDCYENGPIQLAYVSFIVAMLNIFAYFFINKYPYSAKLTLLFINAFFAAFSSYIYIISGKDNIQYGWAVVCIINLYVIVKAIRKKREQNIKAKFE